MTFSMISLVFDVFDNKQAHPPNPSKGCYLFKTIVVKATLFFCVLFYDNFIMVTIFVVDGVGIEIFQ